MTEVSEFYVKVGDRVCRRSAPLGPVGEVTERTTDVATVYWGAADRSPISSIEQVADLVVPVITNRTPKPEEDE